jgi:hypothetical protein
MLNFVENLLENERDPDQDHSLSLSDPDRSLVLSHLLLNFLKNLVSCQTSLKFIYLQFLVNVTNRALTHQYLISHWTFFRLQP